MIIATIYLRDPVPKPGRKLPAGVPERFEQYSQMSRWFVCDYAFVLTHRAKCNASYVIFIENDLVFSLIFSLFTNITNLSNKQERSALTETRRKYQPKN